MNQKATILDTIKKYIADQEHFPVLNPDAVTLQKEITGKDPDLGKIRKLIQTDPTLTGEILKMANSPYYQGLGEISTIKEAALRLGQETLFSLVVTSIHKQNFTSKNPLIKKLQSRLWNHSVSCAIGTQWLARHLNFTDLLSKAFIAGLLHDMGKLCLLSALEKMMASENTDNTLTPAVVKKILDTLHGKQGFLLLKQWHLPDLYCTIARDHHMEAYDMSDMLLVMVRLSNMVCKKIETGDPGEDFSYIMSSHEADILGIKETGIALLEIALEDAGEKLSAMR